MTVLRPPRFTEFQTLGDKLSLGQTAYATVAFDEVDPVDLPLGLRDRAAELFGPIEYVPPECRRVIVQAKGRDVGGTRLASEYVTLLGATATITRAGENELVYVWFGGPKLRHARVGLRFALAACRHHRIKVTDESADGFTMVRHDGRKIRFEVFAASRGGDNIRGVPILAAVLTEAAFYLDELSGVHNGEAILAAIIPRLLPGGRIIIESSVWAESGLLHREFDKNFGNPVTALAAHCPTRLMRDDAETLAMIEMEEKRDADNAARELHARFLPLGTTHLFDPACVKACEDERVPRTHFPWGAFRQPFAGFDAAYQRDGSAGVLAVEGRDGTVVVGAVLEWRPEPGKPLIPSRVDREFAWIAKRCGARKLASDAHYQETIKEHIRPFGLRHVPLPGGNAGKAVVYGAAVDLIHAGLVKWSPEHVVLTRQLKEVVKRPMPGGLMAIQSPRRQGEHGDVASAFCAACWLLAQNSRHHRAGSSRRIRHMDHHTAA